jgi:hypothetical protein
MEWKLQCSMSRYRLANGVTKSGEIAIFQFPTLLEFKK